MANSKLSALLAATALTGAIFLGAQGGVSKQFSASLFVASADAREKLAANRTYYVRTDGSDSNTGLANTSGGAFLTIQKAINVSLGLDLAGFDVTISVADGTYAAGISVSRPFVGGGSVTVTGNTTTPANCVISLSGSGVCVTVTNYARLRIGGFKFVTSGGIALHANTYAKLSLSGAVEFGANSTHVYVTTYATVDLLQNYTISGSAAQHWALDTFATVNVYSRTITLTGTPAFSAAFASADNFSFIYCFSDTFSGSATGKRYNADRNSIIQAGGGGASYLPGNSSGSTSTQAQYL